MPDEQQPETESDPDSFVGPADQKFMKVVGSMVFALALLICADTLSFGQPGEMVYAGALLRIAILGAGGVGVFWFWRR